MYNSINLRATSTLKYKNINIAAVHGLFNDLIVEYRFDEVCGFMRQL